VLIGLLNNLRAGRNNDQVMRMLHYLEQHKRHVISVETDCAEAVPEALADLSRREIDILAVNGGDGSLQHTLTEVLSHRVFEGRIPLIAPLRGGRTTMSAGDLRANRDPVRGMAELIRASRDGTLGSRVVHRKVLRVEYGPSREVAYGMFWGGGLIYRAIELNHRIFTKGRSQGALGATLLTGALVTRAALDSGADGVLTPDKMQILLDGDPVKKSELRLVIASTLGRLFAGMRPFWGEGPGGVRFTTISADAERFSRLAPGVLAGRPNPRLATPEKGYSSHNVDSVVMRCDCGFTVDGELFAPEPGRIIALTADQRVRFVRA
jgi:diacylglycerol kinase (ATP)